MIRLTRRAVRETLCEACGHRYFYLLTRSADVRASWVDGLLYGSEGSSHVALHRTNSRLERALATECDPVPCPACGWYQADMLPQARTKRYGWLTFPTALLLLGGGTALAGASVLNSAWTSSLTALWVVWVASLVVLVCGVVLFLRGLRRRRRYDPNSENVEVRKELGRMMTLTPEQVEQARAEQRLQDAIHQWRQVN